jgi:acyl carrier protein
MTEQWMDMHAVVREVVQRLELLDSNGDLRPLDSLSIVDLVMELEMAAGFEIPLSLLHADNFGSLDELSNMLDEIGRAKARG